MKFPFFKYPSDPRLSGNPWRIEPRIIVNIAVPTSSTGVDIVVLLDTGAGANLFTAEIADLIGIKALESGEEKNFYGVSNQKVRAFGHPVTMALGGHKFSTKVYFSRDVGRETLLLGMEGFFDRFVVTFDRSREVIEIKPAKKSK